MQVKVTEPVLADASELVSVTLYVDGVEFAAASDSVQSYVQRYVAKNGDETGLYGNIMKLSVSALNYALSNFSNQVAIFLFQFLQFSIVSTDNNAYSK